MVATWRFGASLGGVFCAKQGRRSAGTRKQIMEIVKTKGKDLNSRTNEAGFRVIAGTARQMGLEIVD
jgi:ribosomal protein L11